MVKILLAAYNGSKWIDEQLESIKNQTYRDFIVYISIDHSEDTTKEKCLKHSIKDPRIKILPDSERFGCAANNFFRLLQDVPFNESDYISFSDQDDIWFPDKLSLAVNKLKTNYDGYSSNVIAFWSSGLKKLVKKSHPQVKWDYLFESSGPGCTFVITGKVALKIKSLIAEKNSELKKIWAHDWFIYAISRSNGYKWYIDETPSMLYRQHESNQVGVNKGYNAFIYRLKFVLSGEAIKQSFYIGSLCGVKESNFMKKWYPYSRMGMLRLLLMSNNCRRSKIDKLFFMFSCLLSFFYAKK